METQLYKVETMSEVARKLDEFIQEEYETGGECVYHGHANGSFLFLYPEFSAITPSMDRAEGEGVDEYEYECLLQEVEEADGDFYIVIKQTFF